MKPRISRRKSAFFPEALLTRGPMGGEGVTGDGRASTLFGATWGTVWGEGGLELYRLVAGAWQRVEPLSPVPAVPPTARHIAFAFDKSARPVWAWESGGQVFVAQYQSPIGYVVRGPFAGRDPVLVQDATIAGQVLGADVQLYHLSADRTGLIARLERDLYGVAWDMGAFTAPSTLDQATDKGFSLTLWGDFAGAETLSSPPYPVGLEAAVQSVPAMRPGALLDILSLKTIAAAVQSAPALTGSSLLEALLIQPVTAGLNVTPGMIPGALLDVLSIQPVAASLASSPSLRPGSLQDILTAANIAAAVQSIPNLQGGSLAAA